MHKMHNLFFFRLCRFRRRRSAYWETRRCRRTTTRPGSVRRQHESPGRPGFWPWTCENSTFFKLCYWNGQGYATCRRRHLHSGSNRCWQENGDWYCPPESLQWAMRRKSQAGSAQEKGFRNYTFCMWNICLLHFKNNFNWRQCNASLRILQREGYFYICLFNCINCVMWIMYIFMHKMHNNAGRFLP